MQNLSNRLGFYRDIRKATAAFPNLTYSVITGGFAYDPRKAGDVDIITVLPSIDDLTLGNIVDFAKKHVKAQLDHAFSPDWNFPTDVISEQQVHDAVSGRALEVKNQGVLYLKEYTKDQIVSDSESDYRIWLYEMITHDFDLIRGDFNALVRDTKSALKTVFLYTADRFKYNERSIISLQKLREDMFASADLNHQLKEKQCRHLVGVLEKEEIGILGSNEKITLNKESLNSKIHELKLKVRKEEIRSASHIFSWNALREEVKQLNSNS